MSLQLLTVGQVAGLLGCGQSTIWRWRKEGKFPQPLAINGTTRWLLSDIEEFVENRGAVKAEVKPKAAVKPLRRKHKRK